MMKPDQTKSQRRRLAAQEQIDAIRADLARQEAKDAEIAAELKASRDSLVSGPATTADQTAAAQAVKINRSKK